MVGSELNSFFMIKATTRIKGRYIFFNLRVILQLGDMGEYIGLLSAQEVRVV